jgi:AAA domain-containing protein
VTDLIRVGPDDKSPRAYRGSGYSAEAEIAMTRRRIAEAPDMTLDPHYEPVTDEERRRIIANNAPRVAEPPLRPQTWPEPEDRGTASLSALGEVEYVDDLVRPGRILSWAAEEGSGKSYAVDDELAIRVAVAGGSFAGTWPILRMGPILVLSEMHSDDDYNRESTVLASLGFERSALTGRYYRLPLMTAAGGRPALTVPEWRDWITQWLRDRKVILLIVDTATGATQVDPWGREIQAVYRDLRLMLDAYPELSIILVVHVRKPTGRGERRLSDVLGEWGRWCDVVVMQENDGPGLDRTKITVRKRVRHERRIVATKAGGLLIDPKDAVTSGPKVPAEQVIAAVSNRPGMSYAELGLVLGVSKDSASNYVKALDDRFHVVKSGPRGAIRVYPTDEPPNTGEQAPSAVPSVVLSADVTSDHRTAERTYIGSAFGSSVVADAPVEEDDDYPPSAWDEVMT